MRIVCHPAAGPKQQLIGDGGRIRPILALPILHLDEQLVAVDKPAWAVVHPSRGADGALVIVHALAVQLGGPVYPIHRLDRQTSGVLLLARSSEIARVLSDDVREGRLRKTYLGLCRGVLREELRVEHPVLEGGVRRPARTDIEPIELFCDRYTLVRVRPATGRKHQIRYHLKHVDHPLVVDVNYGAGDQNRFFRETFGLRRLFLHAESLRVVHPVEPRQLEIAAPLPAELEEVLARLRGYGGPTV
jgi:tRNA pseudouridine65 synthase